jgi:hypothetical protein
MADSDSCCAYVLRGWLENGEKGEQAFWRTRLQTGKEQAFANVEAVATFLVSELDWQSNNNN